METESAAISGDLLATVREDLLHAKVTALRMLIVSLVCALLIALLSFRPLSFAAPILTPVALLIGLVTTIILLIQVLKILLKGRSTFEIREDDFVWTQHGSPLRRTKTLSEKWQQVATYQYISTRESAALKEGITSSVDPREMAGGALLYMIFGKLPERHGLRLGLRNGKRIVLSELSGDVDKLNQVVTQINVGTVIRMGPGNYKFRG